MNVIITKKIFNLKSILTVLLSCLLVSHISAQPFIVAHRGFSGIAPENTTSSFAKAIEIGADYIELDVRTTKDDSLVVIHDASIDRTCSGNISGKIAEKYFNELQSIKVGYQSKFDSVYINEKIPTLREVLLFAKGKVKVCVEIKVPNIENEVYRLIHELDMINEVIIFSFDKDNLTKIKAINPALNCLYLTFSADTSTVDFVRNIGAEYIGVGNGTILNREFIDYAMAANIRVWKWTVDSEAEIQNLFTLGIQGIITNFPDIAKKVLGKANDSVGSPQVDNL
ncbi:MAG: glycerophosphodiester phosphodiesterase [Bacteroidales bacterium]